MPAARAASANALSNVASGNRRRWVLGDAFGQEATDAFAMSGDHDLLVPLHAVEQRTEGVFASKAPISRMAVRLGVKPAQLAYVRK